MYVSVKVSPTECTGCKLCILTCPDPNVFKFQKENKKVEVNENRCKGCGLCVEICPKKALSLDSM